MFKFIYVLFFCINLSANYIIEVDTNKCLMYFKENSEVLTTFKVATIKNGLPIPSDGYITKVDLNPTWYPTQRTKDYFKEHKGIVLPDVVPPGHPQNYMGSFKITMTNYTKSRGSIYRIHGTLDESTIGKKVSGGCVRMYNNEGKQFAMKIKTLLSKGEKITVKYI